MFNKIGVVFSNGALASVCGKSLSCLGFHGVSLANNSIKCNSFLELAVSLAGWGKMPTCGIVSPLYSIFLVFAYCGFQFCIFVVLCVCACVCMFFVLFHSFFILFSVLFFF